MPFDSDTSLRNMLQPQDALAGLITVLGIAIAIFLPDSIVKLIGGSIGVLGGVALYMTLKGRMHDQVQIRRKKTTLPPPSFKTRVTTDPHTSATRIRFDDFQETFHVEEEREARPSPRPSPHEHAAPGSTVRFDDLADDSWRESADDPVAESESRYGAVPRNVGRTGPVAEDSGVQEDAGEDFDVDTGGGEGFRIIPAGAGASGDATARAEEQRDRTGPDSAETSEPGEPRPEEQPTQRGASGSPSVGDGGDRAENRRRKKKSRGGQKRTESETAPAGRSAPVPTAVEEPHVPAPTPDPTLAVPDGAEAGTVATDEGAAAGGSRAIRRQIQTVLSELTPELEERGGGEPRADFVRLVNQILKAIARSIDGRSIIFFWMNLERGHFIPEACVTRGEVSVRLGERIPLGNDLVSQIAGEGVPEIVTNISPAAEDELAPYYNASTGTRSFVGVPVFFRQEVVGVLAADSAEESGFDEASVATLAEYTLLISQLIRDYAEKFDLYLMRRSLEAFEQLNASLTGSSMRPREIATFLVDQVAGLFDADYAGAILYDKREGRWCVAAATAEERGVASHLREIEPDMHGSVTGEAARSASEIYLSETDDRMLIGPGESLPRGGSFLAVPLMASAKCYGSLILGNSRSNAWVSRDIEMLRDLSRYVAMAIEVVNTNEALVENLVFDEQTGLYNTEFFLGGFEREIDRARDFKTPLSLALVRVETPHGFAPERRSELSHLSISEIGEILSRKIRPYDLIGRIDEKTFGVALVGKSDQEAYLWAERFRKEIAGHIIAFESRTFSVTVSAGVCNATDSSDRTKVIDGARQALERASRDGGNGVVIY